MKKLIFLICFLVIAFFIAWYLISPAFKIIELNEESPFDEKEAEETLKILDQANFIANAHDVKGEALIIKNEENKKILRFEDFETINGPDLFIYLSSDLNAGDFINLGEIKATKGNVNYEIPDGVDLSKYNKVLIWCRAFKVLFSYAEFK